MDILKTKLKQFITRSSIFTSVAIKYKQFEIYKWLQTECKVPLLCWNANNKYISDSKKHFFEFEKESDYDFF